MLGMQQSAFLPFDGSVVRHGCVLTSRAQVFGVLERLEIFYLLRALFRPNHVVFVEPIVL
jgi:hypothetical protein